MNLDIHDTFVTAIILSVLGAIYCIWQGRRTLLAAQRVSFFRIRRQRVTGGWWMIFLGGVLIFVAFSLGRFGEPLVYRYFPPSPTVTRTPTITLTPTISLTPTITETPTITLTPAQSYTPTQSTTPFLPVNLLPAFKSSVTPNPSAVFSPLTFSRSIQNFVAVNPATVFQNPISHMFATYSYDGMVDGSQYTVLWYRNGQLVYYETSLWQGGTGGYNYSEWSPSPDQWLSGTYQVQIFVGTEWKVVGQFLVQGLPPTLTPSPTLRLPTSTQIPSITPVPTETYYPTPTPIPSDTRWPTGTSEP
ncbi:MAG: hypothetical protein ABSB41_11135 [Anaerolineales bacterium]|jgi:hypothetical protein